jgi:choloylglycine hydrolase
MLDIRCLARKSSEMSLTRKFPLAASIITFFTIVFYLGNGNEVVACSAIVLKSEQNMLLAKNFDWTSGAGYVIKNLRGISKSVFPTRAGHPARWTAKYGSITFNQNGKEMPYGGINERG